MRSIINQFVLGMVGISALVAGCAKQKLRVNIGDPEAYIVSLNDDIPEKYTPQSLAIPRGHLTLIIENDGNEEIFQLDGDLEYKLVRKMGCVALYARNPAEKNTPEGQLLLGTDYPSQK